MQAAAKASATGRKFDVVVFGAAGFTGRLVCEHLVKDYYKKGGGGPATAGKEEVRWAMAGRDRGKLEGVRQSLADMVGDASVVSAVPIIVADASDDESLARMCREAAVVVNVAGPYAKYGDGVVRAAVQEGSHYCDITGEVNWVRRMIDAHHAEAERKGVKVVHCCGYDSVPFDIGALVVVDHIRRELGKGTSQVFGLVKEARGGVSGGTIASALNALTSEDGAEVRRALGNKYYLCGNGPSSSSPSSSTNPPRGTDKPSGLRPRWNKEAGAWMAPFVMEPVNTRVVHRSAALAAQPYGRDFKYREGIATKSLAAASVIAGLMAFGGAVLSFGPTRALASRWLPKPGEGPSRELMTTGFWRHAAIGVTEEEEGGAEPQVVVASCTDPARDGGYWSTSRMLLEAGLCLALDAARLEADGMPKGGSLTPASAMGLALADRLRRAGITFDIVQSPAISNSSNKKAAAAASAAEATTAAPASR